MNAVNAAEAPSVADFARTFRHVQAQIHKVIVGHQQAVEELFGVKGVSVDLAWQVTTGRPDVLITDLEMPDEDGFSLLRRARRAVMLRGQRLPVLALTAYGRPDDRVRILAAGFNMHLAKPADPTELVLAVASLTGRTG